MPPAGKTVGFKDLFLAEMGQGCWQCRTEGGAGGIIVNSNNIQISKYIYYELYSTNKTTSNDINVFLKISFEEQKVFFSEKKQRVFFKSRPYAHNIQHNTQHNRQHTHYRPGLWSRKNIFDSDSRLHHICKTDSDSTKKHATSPTPDSDTQMPSTNITQRDVAMPITNYSLLTTETGQLVI